ncbi:Cytochrome bo(3) ubiquinol oxidase subunit 2 [Candidatus Ecksteinia adelgidicola]|nr:Cytochrome bo(3) ubiquinol oxidase subunit 2 [Candidatus Ecksteinia adelgidicola]
MNFKTYNTKIKILLLSTIIIFLNGCTHITLMNPQGYIAIQQRMLIITIITLMLFIVVPVICMALFFTWKYRDTNHHMKYSPDWEHSNKIETIIWIVPIIIIVIIGSITWKTTHELDPFKPILNNKKPINIQVIALDWKWLFIYPKQGIATVNELVFPKNIPILFKITSNSVMNSFFIPQLGSQIYAMAGMQSKLYLMSQKEGRYDGISSSYSGCGFSNMKFTTIVTATEYDFNQWIIKIKKSSNNLNTDNDFKALALPSKKHSIIYFSNVKKNLFQDTISKFMNSKKKDA